VLYGVVADLGARDRNSELEALGAAEPVRRLGGNSDVRSVKDVVPTSLLGGHAVIGLEIVSENHRRIRFDPEVPRILRGDSSGARWEGNVAPRAEMLNSGAPDHHESEQASQSLESRSTTQCQSQSQYVRGVTSYGKSKKIASGPGSFGGEPLRLSSQYTLVVFIRKDDSVIVATIYYLRSTRSYLS
jgi:hypothetical protein